MKRTTIARTIPMMLAMAGLAFAFSACSTTSEKTPPPAPPTGSEFDQGDVDRQDRAKSSNTDIASQLRSIYFDFDRSDIRSDARPILRANGEALRRTGADVVVAGNTDERGSEEYNLALGEARAQSVMKYLVNLGVPASQMSVVSYGEARPAVSGHTEAAWAKNRRVDFQAR